MWIIYNTLIICSLLCISTCGILRVEMMDDKATFLLQQIDTLGRDLLSNNGTQEAEKRSKLRLAARQLSLALEEPGDVVERVCFQVIYYFLP